ncbi:MAG: hypothetical protein IJZ55_13205 [Lachnospiraceae bacterium]|nr:hypothetical protein [Lachnospiraceae bacterium]
MDFISLREQYKEFLYKGFRCEVSEDVYQVTFSYEIPGLSEFETMWKFPGVGRKVDEAILNRLFFELGMAEAISYWKVTCPPVLRVQCGSLTEWQIKWWRKLFYNGLGEFMYINGIVVSEEDLLTIECESEAGAPKLSDTASYAGCLVPVGGGKDSVVSMEVLGEEDVTLYRINPDATVANVLAAAEREYKTCFVNRKLDSRILEMNKRGFLNGHIPFSAVVAFSTFITAYLRGIRYIALSNESSANESTVVGSFVNHQYSKSYEFEADFMEYIESFLVTDIKYFSLLRPLSELQIASLFAKYKNYHKAFRSCNAGSKQGIWCCNCPKCLFVYIILSPFLTEDALVEIFGENLLDAEKSEKYFRELTGLDENKPFECVGTRSEVVMCLKKYLEKGGASLLPVKYREWLLAQPGDVDTALTEWNEVHGVPAELEELVRAELGLSRG